MSWKIITAWAMSVGSLAALSFTNAATAQADLKNSDVSLRLQNFTSGSQTQKLPAKFTNRYRMEFVLIPEGKFTMGSATGSDSERPAHEVTIAQPIPS